MRTLFTFFIVIGLSLPLTAQAQYSARSSDARITIEAMQGLSVQTLRNLDFGTVVVNSGDVTVKPEDADAGEFLISGHKGKKVDITTSGNVDLIGQSTGESITFMASFPTYDNDETPASSTQFDTKTSTTAHLLGGHGNQGEVYVWFGGTINTNGISSDTYVGDYNITVCYN